MENSSKALLIAGCVLIAILLISVGMNLFNSSSQTSEQVESTTKATDVTMFNSKFLKFVSTSTTSSKAKEFLEEVIKNNALATDSSGSFSPKNHQILLNLYDKHWNRTDTHKWKTADLNIIKNKINSSSKYHIYVSSCGTYPNGQYQGYIICMGIRELP